MYLDKLKELAPKSLTAKILILFSAMILLISIHIGVQLLFNSQSNEILQQLHQSNSPELIRTLETQLKKSQQTQLIALIGIAALIALLGFYFSRRVIIHPIKLLINNFKRLAQGEEDIELRIDRSDEYGQLGTCFNEININLQQAMSTWELVMESEAAKAAISDAALDGILTLDNNLIINTYNSAADKMLEIDDFDMSGQSFPEIAFLENDRETYSQEMYKVSDEEQKAQFSNITEINILGRGGNVFPAEISVASVLQKGEPIYIIYIRDISLHKQAEKDLKKSHDAAMMLASKQSDFMANISHEILTPMNGLLGMLSILDRQLNLQDEQKEYFSAAVNSANRLQDIIDNIISFSKLDSGKIEICNVNFLLDELLNVVKISYLKKFESKNLNFIIQPPENCPEKLHSDSTNILKCLNFLLDNALKFTSQGEVSIKIECGILNNESFLTFHVTDSGCGISEEDQNNIFDPFTQADASRSRSHDGAGIGLYMCKQICELMGGQLSLTSEPDKGSTFSLSFPYCKTLSDEVTALTPETAQLENTDNQTQSPETLDSIDMPQFEKVLALFSDEQKTTFFDSLTHSSKDTLEKLERSIKDQDKPSSRALIHSLKGAFSNVHALRLIDICEQFEAAIAVENKSEINEMFNQLRSEVEIVLTEITAVPLT